MSESWAGKRIAVYARYSTELQRAASIDDQVREAERFVQARGGTCSADLTFTDAAESGATLHRPGFRHLMKAVESGLVDVVVTEDISRISRDLADTTALVKTFQSLSVRLVGVSDGVDYAAEGELINLGLKAIMAQQYRTDLRAKTRRGMTGVWNNGGAVGGRAFGYTNTRANNKTTISINAEEAAIVQRIFDMHVSGHALLTIARTLNAEQIPGPRRSGKRISTGWNASTIREILHNAIYFGRRTFGAREWHRDPGTGKRRSRKRQTPAETREHPELRIIDDVLWTATRQRLARVRAKYAPKTTAGNESTGPRAPGRATKYPFSGLLMCDPCGASMVIYGGSPNRLYRCGDVHKRGICKNTLPVQERRASHEILTALQEALTSPLAVAYIRKRWSETLGDSTQRNEADLQRARARLNRIELRLRSFAEMWADGMRDRAVHDAWDDAKREAVTLRDEVQRLAAVVSTPVHLPSAREIEDKILDIKRLAHVAPVEMRQVLAKVFDGGQIRMIPQPDGSYLAKGDALPLLLGAIEIKSIRPRSDDPSEGVYIDGCGGTVWSDANARFACKINVPPLPRRVNPPEAHPAT